MFNKVFLLTAALSAAVVNATTYATFYSDADCTKDASVDFSVNNPGCFSVGGNQYVKYHGANVQCFSLVKSPSPDCPCQFDCIEGLNSQGSAISSCTGVMIPTNSCYHIGQSESLRFVGGSCNSDNCPDRSSRSIPTLEDYQEDEYEESVEATEEPQEEPEPETKRSEIPEQATEESAEEIDKRDSGVSHAYDARDFGKPGVGYFRMCKDKYCTLDCSINFRTTNPGCFAGDGFQSIQMAGGNSEPSSLRLVGTPHGSCSCQDSCWQVLGPECTELPDNMKNKGSYRMVQQDSCDSNNC
ncbi:hypothetical protein E3P99_00939 [Wallemia hederae]|uniref:Uncharacterized protein n=1 Tax=Wallemia hederae TaxID=1540922 RepID=A0A4T0FUK2_9BASI|nr:hypothetical protein E3P99_00939 [Wallemia hederae]